VTSLQLSYIAGLWDGEGCFCIGLKTKNKNKRASPYWFAVASICMTDSIAIKQIQKLFGGAIGKYKRKGICKDVYEWKLWSRKAAKFAKAILPYLKLKIKAARLLIDFQNYLDRAGTANIGPILLTKRDMQNRERYRQRMKKENKRGKV